MKETRQKKVKQINLHVMPEPITILIEQDKAYISIGSSVPKYMNTLSDLLCCLIRNLDRPVERAVLKKYVPEDIESKTFLNYFSNLKKMFNESGTEFIVTGGQGSKYWAKFVTETHCDVVYADDEYESASEYFQQLARTEGRFESLSELTGSREIRTELLPFCQAGGIRYATLSHYAYSVFLNNPINSSLILTADGGAGKTFSLYDTYRGGDVQGVRTIYVHADSLDGGEYNLVRHVAERNLGVHDYHQQRTAFEEYISNTTFPVLFLIDGLNEVSFMDKLKECCRSFRLLTEKFPNRFHGIFATRFPQAVKSSLYNPQEAQLQPLPVSRFKDSSLEVLNRLHIELTPMVKMIMEEIEKNDVENIHSRYDLYSRYFDTLAEVADRKDRGGWIYDVLAAVAAESMKGQTIDSRWLKRFCSAEAESDFIHSYCAGEEYPLEESAAMEKLKATGFLIRDRLDRYTIHQQYRDFLTVRHGLMLLQWGEISLSAFLHEIIDATRYYRLTPVESQDQINARRQNNMDLGEFGFYAALSCFRQHPEDRDALPALVQLGIQVSYLYDNVGAWWRLYQLYLSLAELLQQCLTQGQADERMYQALPGYYFCLNKLVSRLTDVPQLEQKAGRLALSETLEKNYEAYLARVPEEDTERKATSLSGLGGIYLERYRIMDTFEEKNHCLSHAIKYHTDAMVLRRNSGSSRLYRSYAALGTMYFYKGRLYRSNTASDRRQEAMSVFREAAAQHRLAVEQEANQEKYVSWSRMAGCWYELYLCAKAAPGTGSEDDSEACPHGDAASSAQEEYSRELFRAVSSAFETLRASVNASGAARHSGEIRSLLRDVSRYMAVLTFTDQEFALVDQLCELYSQAFTAQKKPVRNETNTGIVF